MLFVYCIQTTVTPLELPGSNLQIICATSHHNLIVYKVSASLDLNCRCYSDMKPFTDERTDI